LRAERGDALYFLAVIWPDIKDPEAAATLERNYRG
jgi:hypothetical protein